MVSADSFSQLDAGLMADITGSGTDQAGDRVLLGILGSVDSYHCLLAVEHHSSKCLRKQCRGTRRTNRRKEAIGRF